MDHFFVYGTEEEFRVYTTREFDLLENKDQEKIMVNGASAAVVCEYINQRTSRFRAFKWDNQIEPDAKPITYEAEWPTINEAYIPEPFRTYLARKVPKPVTMTFASPHAYLMGCISWGTTVASGTLSLMHARFAQYGATVIRKVEDTVIENRQDIRKYKGGSYAFLYNKMIKPIKSGQVYTSGFQCFVKNSSGIRVIGHPNHGATTQALTEKEFLEIAICPSIPRKLQQHKVRYLARILISEIEKVVKMNPKTMQLTYSTAVLDMLHIQGVSFCALWTIYIPEITVVSDHDLAMNLKGLAVVVKIEISDGDLRISHNFCLEKATKRQYYARYAHSHLAGGPFRFGKVCVGSSSNIRDMCRLFAALSAPIGRNFKEDIDSFRMHAELFYSYVYNTASTESTSTGPYKHIARMPDYIQQYFGNGNETLIKGYKTLILSNWEKLKPSIHRGYNSFSFKVGNVFNTRMHYIYDDLSPIQRKMYPGISRPSTEVLPKVDEHVLKSLCDKEQQKMLDHIFINPVKLNPQIIDNEEEIEAEKVPVVFNSDASERTRKQYEQVLNNYKGDFFKDLALAYAAYCQTGDIRETTEADTNIADEVSF